LKRYQGRWTGVVEMPGENGGLKAAGAGAVALVAALTFLYAVSQFLRNSVAVIAPDLAEEMALSAAELGLLSSAFFFAFAAVQLPLGIALDRFGPKRCMLAGAGITVAGILVFAFAGGAYVLAAGRALMGLGCSVSLMGPLALYARRFSSDRFATLTGLQIGLGSIGNLFATAPLAFATASFGWRNAFLGIGVITLLAALAVALVVRGEGAGPATGERKETFAENLSGILAVFRTPSVWRLYVMQLAGYSSFTLVIGLWGGPYLTHIYGFDLTARGELLFIAVIGLIAGSIAWGPTDRLFHSYRRPVLTGAGLTASALLVLAMSGELPGPTVAVWFGAYGVLSAYVAVLVAQGRTLFPPHLVGRGLTLLNTGTMGGVFLTQVISGLVIDFFAAAPGGGYPLEAYQLVFALQAGLILLACSAYWRAPDTWKAAKS
jgi:MFS family permease